MARRAFELADYSGQPSNGHYIKQISYPSIAKYTAQTNSLNSLSGNQNQLKLSTNVCLFYETKVQYA